MDKITNDEEVPKMEFTEQHYSALGKLIIEFQGIEMVAKHSLATFMHPSRLIPQDPLSYMVINELPFKSILNLLSTFVNTTEIDHFIFEGDVIRSIKINNYHEQISILNAGISLAREVEEVRNKLVHSNWLTHPVGGPAGTVLRFKSRVGTKKVRSSSEYLSAQDILTWADKATQAKFKIMESSQILHFLAHEVAKNSIESEE